MSFLERFGLRLPVGRNQLVRAFEDFIEARKALKELCNRVVPKELVELGIQFDDEFAGLATGFDAFLGEEDPNRPTVRGVRSSLDKPAIFHTLEGSGKARGLHPHAWPKLGAGCSFPFNAQQRVAYAHADAVRFREAGVEPGQLGPGPPQLKINGLLRIHCFQGTRSVLCAHSISSFFCARTGIFRGIAKVTFAA